ncbi:MAG: creatininase family protein [Ilumatobacteraceae bacterium]
MQHSPQRLAELRFPEVAGRLTDRSILVQPLGAIEQHGPHLPSTPTRWWRPPRERPPAASAAGIDAWLLPTLSYTKSNEHAWAPGTVWLSAETLLAVLRDLGRCVAMTPTRRLVFLNAHGGTRRCSRS